MNGRSHKIVIVASTGGSVMNALLKNSFFKSQIHSVVSDRQCGAIDKARLHGVPNKIINEKDKKRFCDDLLKYLQNNKIDYVISFFTKLFVGELLRVYRDRIMNLHPALLPSFKGMDGFGDTMRYGVRYMGTTIHFVDEKMDEGKIILQTVCPVSEYESRKNLRHRLFCQQCKSLLQVVKWLCEGRIGVRGDSVVIEGSSFVDYEFSPNLEFPDAINLAV